MLCPTCWQTPQCYRQIISLYLWIFPMPSTWLIVELCLRKAGSVFSPWLPGWRAAMGLNQSSISLITQSQAVVVYNRVIPWVPWGLPLPYIHPIAEKIKAEVPGLLVNVWYLDDGTLCSSASYVAAALIIIEEEGPKYGLYLNRSKWLIHTTNLVDISHPSLCAIPTISGGFGLIGSPICPVDYCEAAFQQRIQKVHEVVSRLGDLQDSQMECTLLRSCLALPKVSYILRTHAIDKAQYAALLDLSPDPRSRALALSSVITHAGDWLSVFPSSALGLHLIDREYRLCLLYWLGLPMSEEGYRCSICNSEADTFGDHQVGCGGNGDRIHRHDSLRDAIFSAAQSAALAPQKEVPSLIPYIQRRPADIYLPNWIRGRRAALDVTVISTLQSLTVNQASSVQGHALMVGEERKRAAHAEACHAVGVSFVPLVAESIGGWSEEAALTISEIGRLQGQRLGILLSETTRHLFQRCSISLWRGNATLWIRRMPTRSPSFDGIL